MNKSILITGMPGTGKSAVSDELKKRGYKTHSIEDMHGFCAMFDRKTGKKIKNHDNKSLEECKQHAWNCDKKKLEKLMKKQKGIVFYSAVVSNLDDLMPLFDKVFLLKASPKMLRKRMSTRTSSSNDFGRTPEIQKWVLSWKNKWEDSMRKRGATIIDANQSLKKVVADIIENIQKIR